MSPSHASSKNEARNNLAGREGCPQNLMDAPIGFYVSTPTGRYVSANPAQARLLGYETPAELIASVTDIATQIYFDPLEREKFRSMLETQDEVVNFECRFRHRSGSIIWGSVNACVVRGANGEVSHYQGYTTDITARKMAEEELRRSEQQYRELIDNINDVVFTVDLNCRITYLSPSAQHIFAGASTLIGRDFMEIVDPQDVEMIRSAWNDILHNHLHANEYRLCLEPGKTVWVRTSSRPAYRDGVLVGAVGVLSEITERKLAEEYLQQVLDATNDGIWDYDLVSGKFGCSNRWAQMLGYALGEVDDYSCYCQHNIHPDDRARFIEAFKDYVEGHSSSYEIEFRLRNKNGEYIWIYSRGKALQRDPSGRALRMVGAHTDISRQKNVEGCLARAKEDADAANRSKSEFLANMSHELRTPLNGIMGMMQLLQTTHLDKEQRNFVNLAIKSSDRLTRLLTDLLDISRIEAGKMDVVDEEFSPQELADSVAELFTVNANARDITLECIIDSAMPPRLVGGIARLRQILFNLVGNSLKFTEKGTVRLEMTPVSNACTNELRVLFSVFDTGIGIPNDKLKDLFKPFAQVESAYTRKYQGAGLGLAIVRRLVELMRGHIFLESALGEGTAVHVVLPFRLPPGVAVIAVPGKMEACYAPPGLRVLLAEDDPSNQFPVQRMLEKAGHVVTLAENGQQAVALLQDQTFDCILMDIQMPVMDGLEATRLIRTSASSEAKRKTPIIALTAYAMSGDRERFLMAGMDDYLAKPLNMSDLKRLLLKHCGSG